MSGRKIHAHKVILSTKSTFFFSSAFTGMWKEGRNGEICLEDGPEIIEAMLRFIYDSDYTIEDGVDTYATPMVFHAKVYSIADKYDVPTLRAHARDKFEQAINTPDFQPAIAEVFSGTPGTNRSLRDVALRTSCSKLKELKELDYFTATIGETSAFAFELIQWLATNYDLSVKTYKCPLYYKVWKAVLNADVEYRCLGCGKAKGKWTPMRATG
ncbi:hypothetical protein AJ80_08883 [Polytolypa hystricis UAMH7299]|uniref:BTB domain-containing protein n=1 Tax=Polytolypa hystricis (strain UAMH7299) TaxID=1447883 RepID=A0A2B7X0Q9_POLH7|nr:hypothetical protein AJ80_08883 [Polytolypa hystricis UAMH7299]